MGKHQTKTPPALSANENLLVSLKKQLNAEWAKPKAKNQPPKAGDRSYTKIEEYHTKINLLRNSVKKSLSDRLKAKREKESKAKVIAHKRLLNKKIFRRVEKARLAKLKGKA